MKLIPQSKKFVSEMKKAGYPVCFSRVEWSGEYERHCNACIENYERTKDRRDKLFKERKE